MTHPSRRINVWRCLVVSLMLKQTRYVTVKPILQKMFDYWPAPESLAHSGIALEELLQPSGFQRRRARELREVSKRYSFWTEENFATDPPPGVVRSWLGCGPYIGEAVKLIVHEDFSGDMPEDRELRRLWDDHHQA